MQAPTQHENRNEDRPWSVIMFVAMDELAEHAYDWDESDYFGQALEGEGMVRHIYGSHCIRLRLKYLK